MAEPTLEKIVGTPKMNSYMGNQDLTGSLHNAVLYFKADKQNSFEQKANYVHFLIPANNMKIISNMISACTLSKNIEAYGNYDKEENLIKITTIKTKYN